MKPSQIDVQCDFCGDTKPVASSPSIAERLAKRPLSQFSTVDVCLDCASEAVRLLTDGRPWELDFADAVNASCTCGGKGPGDEGVCPACAVYHRVRNARG